MDRQRWLSRRVKTMFAGAALAALATTLLPFPPAVPGGNVPATGPAAPVSGPAVPVTTFSIVAHDPETGDLGVAVQSKFFGVGTVVPFAAAGVGAIATQSLANTTFGPRGLERLRRGQEPQAVLDAMLADDPERAQRQVGIVDAEGNAAHFTGDGCLEWAGARAGPHYSVQGNILAGHAVVDAMANAFEATAGDLGTRLVAALAAGQAAGGDARGRQSAALLVVREGGGYGGYDDRYIDLRVDDHATPIEELQRLLDIRHGQLRAESGRRALQEAVGAPGPEADDLMRRGLAALSEATRLDPANGWHWMSLAAAQLATGERDAAVISGVRALEADPWVKTGILRGFGMLEVAEALLADERFRSAWERIPVRY